MLKNKIFMVLCLVLLATFANAKMLNLGKYDKEGKSLSYINESSLYLIYYEKDQCIVQFYARGGLNKDELRQITLNTTCEKFIEENNLDIAVK